MYFEVNTCSKAIPEACPSMSPTQIMQASLRMYAQDAGSNYAKRLQKESYLSDSHISPQSISQLTQDDDDDEYYSYTEENSNFRKSASTTEKQMPLETQRSSASCMSSATYSAEQVVLLKKLMNFLPSYEPSVLEATMKACYWDINKTATLLLEAAGEFDHESEENNIEDGLTIQLPSELWRQFPVHLNSVFSSVPRINNWLDFSSPDANLKEVYQSDHTQIFPNKIISTGLNLGCPASNQHKCSEPSGILTLRAQLIPWRHF